MREALLEPNADLYNVIAAQVHESVTSCMQVAQCCWLPAFASPPQAASSARPDESAAREPWHPSPCMPIAAPGSADP